LPYSGTPLGIVAHYVVTSPLLLDMNLFSPIRQQFKYLHRAGASRPFKLLRGGQARRLCVALAAVVWVAFTPPECRAVIRWTGVNLSGAEFGGVPTPGNLGNYGSAYTYPTANEVTYYMGKGMNVFRLPFRWERMQPEQLGELRASELTRMDAFVNFATGAGATVIIEPHNFQRYYPDPSNFQQSAQGLVGTAVPNAAFVDFWVKLADHYKDNGRVIFNLMNEPTTLPTEQLVATTNQAIAGIRGTGATNIIHVPGNAYTGAHSWTQNWYGTPNATAMLNVVDPAENMVFEVHQYLDWNSSGTANSASSNPQIGTAASPNNTNTGVQRLTAFTNWLKTHGLRGFLGEFALPNDRFGEGSKTTGSTVNRPRVADETLQAMLGYIAANDDVWEGWAWWGGGPWWNSGSYMFGLGPANNNYVNPTPDQEAAALPYLLPYMASEFVAPAGDFNQDDVVDDRDVILWRMSYGRSGLDLAADGDDDGDVDGDDFLVWQQALGMTTTASAAPGGSVPEPSGAVMVALAAALVGRHRRRDACVFSRVVGEGRESIPRV
jgi:aryl-phospho-beta-D-glucosidase BglC (GH1 family)